MEEEKLYEFNVAYSKCKKYDPEKLEDVTENDFDYIWNYIQQSKSLYYLGLLRKVVPLGMLKFRLQEKIKSLTWL